MNDIKTKTKEVDDAYWRAQTNIPDFVENMTEDLRNICQELIDRLEWYVEEDEVNESDPGNTFWITGKYEDIYFIKKAKAILANLP